MKFGLADVINQLRIEKASPFIEYLTIELNRRYEEDVFTPAPRGYHAIVNGAKEPDEDDFNNIATYLDVSVEYLQGLYLEQSITGNEAEASSTDSKAP